MIKSIIFDFDGVILESMDIKTKAFKYLFKDYPEHVGAIVDYHIRNGGISRYKKFSYVYSNILKENLDKNREAELDKIFSNHVVQETIKCDPVDGAFEFLEEYSQAFDMFIASGTPQNELNLILKERKLSKHFKGVFGTPLLKPDIIRDIIESNGVSKEEVVFVGDAISDYEDAMKAEVPFIARFDGPTGLNPFFELKVPVIKNLHELSTLLKKGEIF